MTQIRDIQSELNKEFEIYEKYKSVDSEYLSKFKKGTFTGTAIKPQWIIQALTETFGLCGMGWYYTVKDKWIEWSGESEAKAFVEIELFYKIRDATDPLKDTWSKPVQGMGGNTFSTPVRDTINIKGKSVERLIARVDDDCYKKAETDALGKACQKLGFGASIYMGIEKTKYEDFPDFQNQPPTMNNNRCGIAPHDSSSHKGATLQTSGTSQSLQLSDIKKGVEVSREDAINIISDQYIVPEFRKALKDFVTSVDKKSHDELSTEQLTEFLISQNK